MIEAILENRVGRITLNRPDVHNSLDRQAMRDIRKVLADWVSADICVLILTGTGKSFCSGVSLGDVGSGDWSDNPLTAVCDALENFHAPTICALNGGVYGGGTELAMACDFRIGVEDMKMFVPAGKIGVHYEPAGLARFIQKLGTQTTRRMFLLGEVSVGNELLENGFVDYMVAGTDLEARTDELASAIVDGAPLAVQGMKRTILEISQDALDLHEASDRVTECFASADHVEGLAALSEKRKPSFKGK